MNLLKIRTEVALIVNDSRFSDADLDGYINEAYFAGVAAARLPEYKKLGSVITEVETNLISVLDQVEDFSGVIRLLPSSGKSINKFETVEEFLDENETGVISVSVTDVVFAGTNLWYAPIPSVAETLPFFYYANPPALVGDADSVVLFPELIQRKIMIHGACIPCFNIIEDGVDGPKLNTEFHQKIHEEGLLELQVWNGRRRVSRSVSRWEA